MNLPVSPIQRRNFLTTATKLAAGAALWPKDVFGSFGGNPVTIVERGQWGFLLRIAAELGEQVSYGLITNALYDWLVSLRAAQRQQVQTQNRQLANAGYVDPATRSGPVYAANTAARCVYFPVLYPDELNGLASFYDFCTHQVNARIATPSLFGLRQAAADYRQDRGASAQNASDCFIPIRQQSASMGYFGYTYVRPDEYRTRNNSVVQVQYTRRAANLGEIRVIASNDNLRSGNRRFFDRSYLVNA